MYLIRSFLFLSILTISSITFGQVVRVPDYSGVYLDNSLPYLNASALTAVNDKGNLSFIHKQGLGAFSVFSQNYFNANFLFGRDSILNHGLGIRLINDKAGEYIGVNRLALMYSRMLPLSSDVELHFGVAPVLITYRKEAQNFGGVSNAGTLDAGVWIKNKAFNIGLAANQLISTRLKVIEEVDSIKPQLVSNGDYSYNFNPLWSIRAQGVYVINVDWSNEEVLGFTASYLKRFRAGFNYEFSRNMVFVVGMDQLALLSNSGQLSLDLAYALPSRKNTYRPRNLFEVVVNYKFL